MQTTVPPSRTTAAPAAQPQQIQGRPGFVPAPSPSPSNTLIVNAPAPTASASPAAPSPILPPSMPMPGAAPTPASSATRQSLNLQQQQAQFQVQQHLLQQQQQQQQLQQADLQRKQQQQQQQQQQLLQQRQMQQAKLAQQVQPQQAQQQQVQQQQVQQQPVQQQQQVQQQPVQQQQQVQQLHNPHQGLNGGWQNDKDVEDRKRMIAKIVHLLQARKPNAPQEWLKKLPQMAKRLEESLYKSAGSFEAYNDVSTLKHRLQQLAMNIGSKSKKMQAAQTHGQVQLVQQKPQPQQAQQTQFQTTQQQLPGGHVLNGQLQPQQQPTQQPLQPTQQQMLQQPQVQSQPQHAQHPPQRQIVNMSDINPIIGGASHQQHIATASQAGGGNTVSEAALPQVTAPNAGPQNSFPVGGLPGVVDPKNKVNGQRQIQQVANPQVAVSNCSSNGGTMVGNATAAPVSAAVASSSTNTSGSRPGSDRQQVLRHQQQRLLLLRHAAKCPHEDGRCPVTPHCAGMKRLWKHIAECKDQKCLVPHCVSSRYVLSHYHRCKDVRCPVCGPVREAIHRSHEKQKQMQALKQRHEQAMNQARPPLAQSGAAGQSTQPKPVSAPAKGASVAQSPQPTQPLPTQTTVPAQVGGSVAPPAASPVPSAVKIEQTEVPTKKRKTELGQTPAASSSSSSATAAAPVPNSVVSQAQSIHTAGAPVAVNGQATPQPGHPVATQPLPQQPPQAVKPLAASTKAPFAFNSKPATTSSEKVSSIPGVPNSAQVVLPAVPKQPTGPKPQEDHTLINSFTIEQIETHIQSLNRGLQLPPQKLKLKCIEVLKGLQSHQHAWVFNSPVDPVELGLPDYFQVIKRPMDLGTIRKRLENGCYHSIEDFEGDVCLTFDNAMLYNPEGSVVYNMAEEMKSKFVVDHENLIRELNREEDEKRKNGDACAMCGSEKLLFEPPVFYCNGLSCPSKRIRRNSYYYVGGNNQYHWCHQCYGELKENQPIEMADVSLKKAQLVKKKNDEVHEESWVQCDKCERWIHQICGLFNTRQNKDQRSEFTCPRCTIEERKKKNLTEGTSRTPMAEDLPRTKLSEHLEEHVRIKSKEHLTALAQEKVESEGVSMDEAKKSVAMGGPITIRQVTSMDRKLEVRERMKRRYAFKNYPAEFTFRCKCIIVFQNLDGVDVILFGLYVYEHDEKNPEPNKRSVYVSYLDSVHYMRPRKMRTLIYHEILIAYLDYVRRKGFATAHIWACPPLKGDDYILYAKPEDQKTPRDDRLRQWYIDMLVDCQRRGIVGKITNMYDLYFSNPKSDATVVPYMDGDYFPAEAENIIKDLEEGKNSKKSSTTGKKKKGSKSKSKSKSGRGGTRSTGLDQDALAASGIVPPGVEQKSLEEGGRDFVMVKLGETIQPMKESFIVAYLRWSGAKEEDMVVPQEIVEYRKKHGIKVSSGRKSSNSVGSDNSEKSKPEDKSSQASDPNKTGGDSKGEPKPTQPTNGEDKSTQGGTQPTESSSSETDGTGASGGATVRDGKFAAMAARKRDMEGNVKSPSPPPQPNPNPKTTVRDSHGRLVKVLDDDLEEMDCEFLNNRQAFLNLCQGNHYQFDQLRRAKHTSMMVLWHLHNRDAPKFVQQCAVCSREILTGYRYHCPTCADYDQCHECVSNPKTPRHPHQLKPIPVASGQQSELTEAQRKERQRSIQLHMTLLLHAATCVSPKCPSANCTKMKGLLKHGAQCQVKVTGGCHVCKRIWALLQIHARQCKQTQCPVPNCMAIRERFRQLTKQQQAMDDRRRKEMNRAYRGGSR